jgi:hypothetical protein
VNYADAPSARESFRAACFAEVKEYNKRSLRNKIMCMLDEIRAKHDEIYAIARAHKAEKLWMFGSRVRKMVMKFYD